MTATLAHEISYVIKRAAERLGFAHVGICPSVRPTGLTHFAQWLAAGYAGEMRYLPDRADAYHHPRSVLDGVRSLVMLGMPYQTGKPRAAAAGEGRIARYAWGSDYHDLIRARLDRLAEAVHEVAPQAKVRGVVDTAPLLEREFAQLAGLGWIGKNTLLLNRESGSYFFLAAVLTDLELEYDEPLGEEYCGSCRACLDACPTGAFVAPYVLDSRRCISYLTIELRDAIPHELRAGIGDWFFGCDICQEVCPWNQRAVYSLEPAYRPRDEHDPMKLAALFTLSDDAFKARFRGTPLWRAKRRGLLRNAALVLGNQRAEKSVGELVVGLEDREPVVRGACAWALGRLGIVLARSALEDRRNIEEDPGVQAEIERALAYT